MKKALPFISLVAFLALSTCATTKGSLFRRVIDSSSAPQASSAVEIESSDSNPPQTGLEVQTDPSDAQVYLNGIFIGVTPLVYTDFQTGTYKITISKRGYRENTRWLNLDPTAYTILQADLMPKIGYLLISAVPSTAEITIDGVTSESGVHQIPVGLHTVRIQAFGYEDWTRDVDVRENQTVRIQAALSRARFRVSGLSASRAVLNPLNPGLLGTVTLSFQVSSSGEGTLTIDNSQGRTVFRRRFPRFTERNQTFVWDGRGENGNSVPDGRYRIIVSGRQTGAAGSSSETVTLTIDRRTFVELRSVLSGTSGLLFSATPEVLPASSYSIGSIALAHIDSSGAIVPVQVSVRAVPYPGIEIDGQATVQIMSTNTVPYSVGVAGKFPLVRSSTRHGFSAALTLKGTYLSGTNADTLTNFSGLSVGAPLEYRIGPVGIVVMPEVIAAPYAATYTAVAGPVAPTFWGYGRGGLFLDLGSFATGVSAAVKTRPFSQGFGPATVPLAAGWEVHWLIPDTQLVITGAVAGEYSPGPTGGYYLMAGAGIGFIN